jgi:hypothetical protein
MFTEVALCLNTNVLNNFKNPRVKKLLILFGVFWLMETGYSQVLIMSTNEGVRDPRLDYEYGYLPGRKFPFYQTINQYDLKGLRVRVELFDERRKLGLVNISCSPLIIENVSEFGDTKSIYKVAEYIDTLFNQTNMIIDSTSKELVEIRLQALDSRLIGFGYIKIHGLCQIEVKYKELNKIYCVDIKDGDDNSPLGSNAMVTRKGGTRVMGSAAIREVLEQFIVDLKMLN